jgi:hypothetical protein
MCECLAARPIPAHSGLGRSCCVFKGHFQRHRQTAKVVPDVPTGHGEICLAGGFGRITHGSLEVGIKIGKAILVKV